MAKSKKAMTKSALYAHLAEKSELKKSQIAAVLDHLTAAMTSELKKNGLFTLPGVARFKIRKVCIVADRGMISQGTIEDLEQQGWPYILGARMRRQKEPRLFARHRMRPSHVPDRLRD